MNQLKKNLKKAQMLHTALVLVGFTSIIAGLATAEEGEETWSGSFTVTLPPQGGIEDGNRILEKYAADKGWKTGLLSNDKGDPVALQLFIPSPLQGKQADGAFPATFEVESFLPRRPQWYIYRFQYLEFEQEARKEMPFKYVEVDWNTEGLPRGPNDSFTTPHYDFHFYTKSRDYVESKIGCESAGKTCDFTNSTTDAVEKFFDMPSACFLPKGYFPDVGSSIPEMGLHLLDSQFQYTVDNVNHNPVIIYGTFRDEIVFLEASLTLFAFEDAVTAAGQGNQLSWPIRQPEKYQHEWWPQTVTLEYLPQEDVFVFSYGGFTKHETNNTCDPS